jgi:hypothetical protein
VDVYSVVGEVATGFGEGAIKVATTVLGVDKFVTVEIGDQLVDLTRELAMEHMTNLALAIHQLASI